MNEFKLVFFWFWIAIQSAQEVVMCKWGNNVTLKLKVTCQACGVYLCTHSICTVCAYKYIHWCMWVAPGYNYSSLRMPFLSWCHYGVICPPWAQCHQLSQTGLQPHLYRQPIVKPWGWLDSSSLVSYLGHSCHGHEHKRRQPHWDGIIIILLSYAKSSHLCRVKVALWHSLH